MTENFTEMLNRNFGMSYGDNAISRNSTGKMTSISIHSLEGGTEGDEEMNGNLWNHEGVNLGEKFGAEMLDFDSPWDWIQNRINNENWTGINVGDYIEGQSKRNNVIYRAFILGINTYRYTLPGREKPQIDFAFRLYNSDGSMYNISRMLNSGNCNNSLQSGQAAYKATDIYFYLNSLSGTIRTSTTATADVDYTENGFLNQYVPDDISAKIAEKTIPCPVRFSSSTGLTTNDTGRTVTSIGKIWLLDICEIKPFSFVTHVTAVITSSFVIQYPFFANNSNIGFLLGASTGWTRSPASGSNSTYLSVNSEYTAVSSPNNTYPFIPCFRLIKED